MVQTRSAFMHFNVHLWLNKRGSAGHELDLEICLVIRLLPVNRESITRVSSVSQSITIVPSDI